jgi:hypothetical protein
MKKIIAGFVVFVFVLGIAATVYARTAAEELEAIRDYLKVLDTKIIRHRRLGNRAVVLRLQAEKKGTILRAQKVKARAEAEAAPPPVEAAPPPPPPPPVAVKPVVPEKPKPAGLFGMGIPTSGSFLYIAGNSTMGLRGDIVLSDMLEIGPMIGLSADSINYKIGLGYTQGKDINDNEWKSIPLFIDGIINFPEDVLGVESYIGGGLNFVVYRTSQTTGSYGLQAYAGIQGDLLEIGSNSFAEVGYSIVRTGPTDPAFSSKGFSLSLGQQLVL